MTMWVLIATTRCGSASKACESWVVCGCRLSLEGVEEKGAPLSTHLRVARETLGPMRWSRKSAGSRKSYCPWVAMFAKQVSL
jgi:hypothetical protein